MNEKKGYTPTPDQFNLLVEIGTELNNMFITRRYLENTIADPNETEEDEGIARIMDAVIDKLAAEVRAEQKTYAEEIKKELEAGMFEGLSDDLEIIEGLALAAYHESVLQVLRMPEGQLNS